MNAVRLSKHFRLRLATRLIPREFLDYFDVLDQILIVVYSFVPGEYSALNTEYGTAVFEDNIAVTWLEPDKRPKKKTAKGSQLSMIGPKTWVRNEQLR